MGKVSIRNRGQSPNNDNTPQNRGSSPPVNTVQTNTTGETFSKVDNSSVNSNDFSNTDTSDYSPPKAPEPVPQINKSQPSQQPVIGRGRPIEASQNNGIFKGEENSNKEFKGLFGGTNKLFAATGKLFAPPEEDTNKIEKVQKNILDKLNVNKRMFYMALGLAGISSFLVITYLQSFSGDKLFGSEMVPVIVANKPIAEKAVITLEDLAQKEVPKKFVLENAIVLDGKNDPKDLVGKIALTDIYENEQISSKRVSKQEESPWLSPSVPVNHRAFTIPSRSLSYIKPKDHVDVIVSLIDPGDKGRMINTPVLQNALVLAVDGKYKVTQVDNDSAGETVTVAVPNKLVNFFSLLQDKGNFQLVLRRDGDTTNLESKYSVNQLEVMLNTSNIKPEKLEPLPIVIPKPVVREVVKPVYNPPAYNPPPVYNPPVYNPPVRVYNPPPQKAYTPPKPKYVAPKPVAPKPVAPKPVVQQQVPKPVAPPPSVTVTVINGNSVSQSTVKKDK